MTTSNEMNKQLMLEWIKNHTELTDEQSVLTEQLMTGNLSSVIYKLLDAANDNRESFSDPVYGLSYTKENDSFKVTLNNSSASFSETQMKDIFCAVADIFCSVLPAGSVIKLKKDIKDDTMKNEDPLIMIDRRFVYAAENSKAFYTYSGIIYPFGSYNKCIRFNFTPNAVAEVIHKGYSDETEEAFVFKAKDELCVKMGMHSFSCASKEDKEDFMRVCSGEKTI